MYFSHSEVLSYLLNVETFPKCLPPSIVALSCGGDTKQQYHWNFLPTRHTLKQTQAPYDLKLQCPDEDSIVYFKEINQLFCSKTLLHIIWADRRSEQLWLINAWMQNGTASK